MNTNRESTNEITDVVFRAVALAMGVAVVVLNILGTASTATMLLLLGIGLFCAAIALFK